MRDLYFDKPHFREGENLTVRRGAEWSMGIEGLMDTELQILAAPNEAKGEEGQAHFISYGRITNQKVMRFCDLTDVDLHDEHWEDCQTYEGLKKVLKTYYKDFDEREIVTLLYFELVKE